MAVFFSSSVLGRACFLLLIAISHEQSIVHGTRKYYVIGGRSTNHGRHHHQEQSRGTRHVDVALEPPQIRPSTEKAYDKMITVGEENELSLHWNCYHNPPPSANRTLQARLIYSGGPDDADALAWLGFGTGRRNSTTIDAVVGTPHQGKNRNHHHHHHHHHDVKRYRLSKGEDWRRVFATRSHDARPVDDLRYGDLSRTDDSFVMNFGTTLEASSSSNNEAIAVTLFHGRREEGTDGDSSTDAVATFTEYAFALSLSYDDDKTRTSPSSSTSSSSLASPSSSPTIALGRASESHPRSTWSRIDSLVWVGSAFLAVSCLCSCWCMNNKDPREIKLRRRTDAEEEEDSVFAEPLFDGESEYVNRQRAFFD